MDIPASTYKWIGRFGLKEPVAPPNKDIVKLLEERLCDTLEDTATILSQKFKIGPYYFSPELVEDMLEAIIRTGQDNIEHGLCIEADPRYSKVLVPKSQCHGEECSIKICHGPKTIGNFHTHPGIYSDDRYHHISGGDMRSQHSHPYEPLRCVHNETTGILCTWHNRSLSAGILALGELSDTLSFHLQDASARLNAPRKATMSRREEVEHFEATVKEAAWEEAYKQSMKSLSELYQKEAALRTEIPADEIGWLINMMDSKEICLWPPDEESLFEKKNE